jgi:hypothetical protein
MEKIDIFTWQLEVDRVRTKAYYADCKSVGGSHVNGFIFQNQGARERRTLLEICQKLEIYPEFPSEVISHMPISMEYGFLGIISYIFCGHIVSGTDISMHGNGIILKGEGGEINLDNFYDYNNIGVGFTKDVRNAPASMSGLLLAKVLFFCNVVGPL